MVTNYSMNSEDEIARDIADGQAREKAKRDAVGSGQVAGAAQQSTVS